ncbi:MAG: phospholipid-binding lipoprotein MlaA [Enterobacterales bacterium]|jgi:phospholipid-binding lipoprotein MlaA
MNQINNYILSILVLILSGCASSTDNYDDPNDPYEAFNRASYSFNKAIDSAILKPVAKGYDAVTPEPVKIGVSNFFSNLGELPTIFNDLLQGKISDAFSDLGRFIINSTLGLAGLFDVATDLGLDENDEDFGQTLGAWGFESGSYLMLPLLGPTTVRDLIGTPADGYLTFSELVDHIPTRNTLYFLRLVDLRYRLLPIDAQLEDALDEYTFVKDAFLMRREYQVYDGNPPEDEDFYDDFYDDCEEDCDDDIID